MCVCVCVCVYICIYIYMYIWIYTYICCFIYIFVNIFMEHSGIVHRLAKTFFRLLDKHIPKPNTLYKVFNRNTVKVSSSCTENVKHN